MLPKRQRQRLRRVKGLTFNIYNQGSLIYNRVYLNFNPMQMRYTTTQVHEQETGAECSLAVQAFIDLKRAEKMVEKKEKILNEWLSAVPKEDLGAYAGITASIEAN